MAEDLINNKDIYFPSYLGTNDKLITLLNRANQILCDWFSKADKNGPLPFDESFKCIMPAEDGNSDEELFSEIESLLNNSFNPVHPGSLAHLDPPPLIFSILGDLIAAGLNNNLLAYELSPSITLLEESLCKWFAKKIGFNDSSGGIAASGGTLSNLNALIAARHNSGLGSDPNSVFLVSEDAHSSFIKCIRIMGLDEANLIRIKTDNNGSIDIQNLRKTIDRCFVDNKKNLLLFSASKNDSNDIFAMSMCVKNKNNLWGRYWGSQEEISNLHFELCYYQPIEWAIKNSIHLFDPGAGGKHKRRRGFFAKSTVSMHKWFDKNMVNIIYPWLNEVNKQTEMEIDFENKSIPFK